MTQVNYGSATPESIVADRFGIRQTYELSVPRAITQRFEPANTRGVIKRLGLVLRAAWKAWPGLHEYSLVIDERPVHIRSYSDGRLRILVDGETVFTEKVAVKTVAGIKHQQRYAAHVGDEEQDWVMQKLHAEALIENTRWELDRRRKQINNKSTG